jgi:hypothetical protein
LTAICGVDLHQEQVRGLDRELAARALLEDVLELALILLVHNSVADLAAPRCLVRSSPTGPPLRPTWSSRPESDSEETLNGDLLVSLPVTSFWS